VEGVLVTFLMQLVSSANAFIVRLSNKGCLPERVDWFLSSSRETIGYAYGGAHGAASQGLGVGFQMARCALRAFGASLHLKQNFDTVEASICVMRKGDLQVV
jgi:hypothetical protein